MAKYKTILEILGGGAANLAILSPFFINSEPVTLPKNIKAEAKALNSNPNYRYADAHQQRLFTEAYRQHRENALKNESWTYKYKSPKDREELETAFDKGYARQMQGYKTK